MTDISLQFHATPDELLPLVRAYLVEEGYQISALRYHPFRAVVVDLAELDSVFADPSVRRVVMTAYAPEVAVGGMNEFLDRNPSALQLDIGRNSPKGLDESWLTGRTEDKQRLKSWRKLLGKIRVVTSTGVVAINPDTGATGALKAHRFSEGAKALDREGVPILAVAGKTRLKFEGQTDKVESRGSRGPSKGVIPMVAYNEIKLGRVSSRGRRAEVEKSNFGQRYYLNLGVLVKGLPANDAGKLPPKENPCHIRSRLKR